MALEHDEIGICSEVKLAIIRKYATAYTTVLESQRRDHFPRMRWFYIDGYRGSGHHVSKTRGDLVDGSPLIALNTKPAFHEYHFIDSDTGRTAELRKELIAGLAKYWLGQRREAKPRPQNRHSRILARDDEHASQREKAADQ